MKTLDFASTFHNEIKICFFTILFRATTLIHKIFCTFERRTTSRDRDNRKLSPVCRLGLTHGRQAVPKITRQNTEQFFTSVTRRQSTVESSSLPTFSVELRRDIQRSEYHANDEQEQRPMVTRNASLNVLPPIRTASSSKTSKPILSTSFRVQPTTDLSPIISPEISVRSSTLMTKSSTPAPLPRRQFRHGGPVDHNIFRDAYDRALSVARSRLLFRDPYSLTRSSATHGVLYSYYDHTPMCVFSRGAACVHRVDVTDTRDRTSKPSVFRKKIFDDVVVEHYIQ